MQEKMTPSKTHLIFRIIFWAVTLNLIAALTGCGGIYGSYQRDPEIYRSFQSNQVTPSFMYYYNGVGNQIYAIIGIEPRYQIHSKFWREVKPDTEEFKKLTSRIWEDYGYRTYGAAILDPSGNKIGIVYTSIYEVAVKFIGDDRIEVMLGTPYLWGPDGGDGHIRTPD